MTTPPRRRIFISASVCNSRTLDLTDWGRNSWTVKLERNHCTTTGACFVSRQCKRISGLRGKWSSESASGGVVNKCKPAPGYLRHLRVTSPFVFVTLIPQIRLFLPEGDRVVVALPIAAESVKWRSEDTLGAFSPLRKALRPDHTATGSYVLTDQSVTRLNFLLTQVQSPVLGTLPHGHAGSCHGCHPCVSVGSVPGLSYHARFVYNCMELFGSGKVR